MPAEPKYKKMYKDSPTLATDENGKKYIKKGPTEAEKKTAEVDSGTDGIPVNESGPMYDRHMGELSDMNDRHLAERKDMTKRHMKDMQKAAPEKDGEEVIDKVEKNKGE